MKYIEPDELYYRKGIYTQGTVIKLEQPLESLPEHSLLIVQSVDDDGIIHCNANNRLLTVDIDTVKIKKVREMEYELNTGYENQSPEEQRIKLSAALYDAEQDLLSGKYIKNYNINGTPLILQLFREYNVRLTPSAVKYMETSLSNLSFGDSVFSYGHTIGYYDFKRNHYCEQAIFEFKAAFQEKFAQHNPDYRQAHPNEDIINSAMDDELEP